MTLNASGSSPSLGVLTAWKISVETSTNENQPMMHQNYQDEQTNSQKFFFGFLSLAGSSLDSRSISPAKFLLGVSTAHSRSQPKRITTGVKIKNEYKAAIGLDEPPSTNAFAVSI